MVPLRAAAAAPAIPHDAEVVTAGAEKPLLRPCALAKSVLACGPVFLAADGPALGVPAQSPLSVGLAAAEMRPPLCRLGPADRPPRDRL